jgi:hypothetical protein
MHPKYCGIQVAACGCADGDRIDLSRLAPICEADTRHAGPAGVQQKPLDRCTAYSLVLVHRCPDDLEGFGLHLQQATPESLEYRAKLASTRPSLITRGAHQVALRGAVNIVAVGTESTMMRLITGTNCVGVGP